MSKVSYLTRDDLNHEPLFLPDAFLFDAKKKHFIYE